MKDAILALFIWTVFLFMVRWIFLCFTKSKKIKNSSLTQGLREKIETLGTENKRLLKEIENLKNNKK